MDTYGFTRKDLQRKTVKELRERLQNFNIDHVSDRTIGFLTIEELTEVLDFIDETKRRLLEALENLELEKELHKNP